VRNAAFDIHAITPRSVTVRIAHQVHQSVSVQENRMTHVPRVGRDPFGVPPDGGMRQISNSSGRAPMTK
jgi:hypothetical protein